MTNWTNPDHEKMLREIWPSGLSRSQMAVVINKAFKDAAYSREAIIGKGYRLGLPPAARASAPKRIVHQRPTMPKGFGMVLPAIGGPTQATPIALMQAAAIANAAARQARPEGPVEPRGSATILTLKPRQCRWPIGDPSGDGFTFCGSRAENGPYCDPHRDRAYQPLAAGRPRTGNELARSLRRYV